MEKAFIFHGTGATREDHWFPWLHEKLEEEGVEVCRPAFPTPENQELENWLEILDEKEMEMDEDTVLIGHSLGAVFILNILNRRDLDIEAAYLVSAWTGLLGDEDFDEWNSTFQDQKFDFEKIKNSIGEIHQFHSASDPYVPMEKAEKLAQNLDSNLHLKEGAGHFNDEFGYTEFSELLEIVL
jgi:predicted alpha/beta hydrolase family esterase